MAVGDRSWMASDGLWETWRSPPGETVRSFAIITNYAERTVRADPQPDAFSSQSGRVAGARRSAPAQGPTQAVSGGGDDALAGERSGRQHAEKRSEPDRAVSLCRIGLHCNGLIFSSRRATPP